MELLQELLQVLGDFCSLYGHLDTSVFPPSCLCRVELPPVRTRLFMSCVASCMYVCTRSKEQSACTYMPLAVTGSFGLPCSSTFLIVASEACRVTQQLIQFESSATLHGMAGLLCRMLQASVCVCVCVCVRACLLAYLKLLSQLWVCAGACLPCNILLVFRLPLPPSSGLGRVGAFASAGQLGCRAVG